MHEGDDADRRRQLRRRLRQPGAPTSRASTSASTREYQAFNRELETLRALPAETTDGRRVNLYANVGLIADLPLARRHGAEGIGLYRTEFPFLTYRDFPDEEEQYQLYARVVRGMEGRPVTIRTLDIGADKYPSYLQLRARGEPVPRLALDPHLARDARALQGAAPRHPARRRRSAACASCSR